MIKKNIKFVDYDGVEREEVHYFNLSKAEVTEMELSENGGLSKILENIVAEKDAKRMMEIFKDLIQKAYGVKSNDGRRFIKTKENLDNFMQTEAYTELFIELTSSDASATEFVNGILPKFENKPQPAPMAKVNK